MPGPDADTETRRLILRAADRFGGPESDVGELPYDDAGFDAAFDSMRGHLRRTLAGGIGEFMHQVLDEASTVFASTTGPDGKEWHVEARLFAMMASGRPRDVAAVATPEGFARIAAALGTAGLCRRSTKLAFIRFPLPLSVLGDLSPGRLRRVTRCLASGIVPGLPPTGAASPLDALGLSDDSFSEAQYAARPGTVTRGIVGIRCVRARPDRRMARDWFSGFDADDAPDGAHAGWESAMSGDGAEVGMPMSWMEVAGLVAADHLVGALALEASGLGFGLDLGEGTVHHFEEDASLAVALALPNGRVLGPARAPRDAMIGGMDLLSSVLGASGRPTHSHVGSGTFSRLVMMGAAPAQGEDDRAEGDMPGPVGRDAGDGLPAIH